MTATGRTAALQGGISPPHDGAEWHILGHTYWNRAWSEAMFAFETYDPPGTFVPPHVHPAQDEFIFVIDGNLEVELDGRRQAAPEGSLVKMPRGVPHGYFNTSDAPTRCLFWVTPAGKLKELFDLLHELTDLEQIVRVSAEHDVEFLPPEG
jgi:mannose-6-phosphate isomerase-like protein (cupin superfamily)